MSLSKRRGMQALLRRADQGTLLSMQDAARRQADERAALEARVFITHPRLPAHHATTPNPFSVSSAEAQVNIATVDTSSLHMLTPTFPCVCL
jgi:hypothetical protein